MAMTEQQAGNLWIENLLRPALIAGMMVCLASPFVQILGWILGDWDGTVFLVFCFLASLEGILSERTLQKRRITGWAYASSRGIEALLLLLLLKVSNYVPLGLEQLVADARMWPIDPYLFVSGLDLFTGLVFLPLWLGSIYVARVAMALDVDEHQASPPEDKTSPEYYLWLTQPPMVRDRQERLAWLGEAFVWGGFVLLGASALIFWILPTTRPAALPTLLYFALGVALLSQARFSVTRMGWQVQGLSIQPGIARRWLLWAALFLCGVALIALLLPTGYAMGPWLAILTLFGALFRGIMLVLSTLYFLLILLLSLLFPNVKAPERPPTPLEPMPPFEPTPEPSVTPGIQALLSVLFWSIILIVVGYTLFRFWEDRFGAVSDEEGPEGRWWQRLLAWLQALWQQWGAWRRGVQARMSRLQIRRRRMELGGTGAFRAFFPGRLPPRERVRYYYLSAEWRAAQAGQPRAQHQTPYEYRDELDQRFPDLEPDLEGLTEAFIEARYSRRPVEQADAEEVKPLWQRIKTALRRRRKRTPSGG